MKEFLEENEIKALLNQVGISTKTYHVTSLGENPNKTILIGGKITIHKDLEKGQWVTHHYEKNLLKAQLEKIFSKEPQEPPKSKEGIPCNTQLEALTNAIRILFEELLQNFQKEYNQTLPSQDGPVKELPKEAIPIEDERVLHSKAMELADFPIHTLPKSLQVWLQSQDWKGAKAIYSLKPKYKISTLAHGYPATHFREWSLYQGPISEPYETSKTAGILPYSKGIAIPSPSQKGYEVFFLILQNKVPKVFHLKVNKERFRKLFTYELPKNITVNTTYQKVTQRGNYQPRPTPRKIRLENLLNSNHPIKARLLPAKETKILEKADFIAYKITIEETALNPHTQILLIKIHGELYLAKPWEISKDIQQKDRTHITIQKVHKEALEEIQVPFQWIRDHDSSRSIPLKRIISKAEEYTFLFNMLQITKDLKT